MVGLFLYKDDKWFEVVSEVYNSREGTPSVLCRGTYDNCAEVVNVKTITHIFPKESTYDLIRAGLKNG